MTSAQGSAKSATRDVVASAILVALVLTIPLLLGGRRALPSAFQDDAFYYARIARNVARGGGLTFDGLHTTSGFHPLWLALLVPIFVVWSGPVPPLLAVVAFQILLASGAAAVMTAALARIVDRWSALAGGMVFVAIPSTGASLTGGLEGALALASVAVAWSLWLDVAKRVRSAPSAWIGPGLAFALAGLARLEAFVFLPVVLVLSFKRMGKSATSVVALCAPGAAAVALLMAANRALTSTWLPISGAIKAAARLNRMDGRALPVATGVVLAFVAAAAALVAMRRAGTDVVRAALALLGVAAALWIAADLLSVGTLEPWNRIPVLLLCVVGVVALASRGRGKIVAVAVALLTVARLSVGIAREAVPTGSYAPYRWAAGVWLRDHLEADARIGSWNAGTIGYASDRQVVNLDGLVNDRTYLAEVLRGHDLEGYLERERISWIAEQACGVDPTLEPYLRRTGSQALSRRAELVASFYDHAAPDGCPGVAIWRLRGD